MAELAVRKFLASDVDRIELREGQLMQASTPERVKLNADYGPCMTLALERGQGEILVCGGIVSFYDNVGEMWMMCGRNLDGYRKSVVASARDFLEIYAPRYHRLHMAVRADNARNIRFAEFMGFHQEARHRKFDEEGNDFIMMARIR